MLRVATARTIPKSTVSLNVARVLVPHTFRLSHKTPLVRYNASKSSPTASPGPEKAKVSHNPDWSAPIVTYEQVKALVRNPVPVSPRLLRYKSGLVSFCFAAPDSLFNFHFFFVTRSGCGYLTGRFPDRCPRERRNSTGNDSDSNKYPIIGIH